jgi:photosystem II stability/assembly factor-like uncharacterized protein
MSLTRTLWTACLGILLVGSAAGQTWNLQTPSPTDRDLYGAAFTSPDHGFIISLSQGLFETFDGGDTWTKRSLSDYGSSPYYDIHFFDDQLGWITGNNDDQLMTTDGGANWQPMDAFAGSWSHIDFVSSTVGFFGANGALAKSSNGGQTWEIRSGYPNCPVIYGMDFRDESVGLVAGNDIIDHTYGIFRTTDGGQTWAQTLDGICNDVVFLDDNTAIAASVDDQQMYKSTDAGQTWTAWSGVFEEDGPLGDLTYVGGTRIAGCSSNGDVWISEDLGLSWTKTLDAIGDLPYWWELNFVDMDNGWLTGNHGILYRTTDGGFTWEYVTNGIGMDIHHIEMLTESYGLALADNGYLLRTTDGGQDWSVQKLEVTGQVFNRDENLYALDIVDEQFAVAAGPGGTVFRTLDGGIEWESIGYPELPGGFLIRDVEFIDHNIGYVVGSDYDRPYNKGFYKTVDGGLTWTRPFDEDVLGHVDAVDAQHVWIMHLGGRIHATRDGGGTWSDTFLPADYLGGDATIEDMEFIDADTGWVCGWWDYIAKTTDGGDSWQTFTFGNNHSIRVALGLTVISADELWVTAVNEQLRPILLHTTNGGQSWTRTVLPGFQYGFSEIDASPNGSIWAGGFRGNIISNVVPCDADFNSDGAVNTQDVLAFLNAWAAGDLSADFNGDGSVNTLDVLAFLNAWGAGC